MFALDLDKLTPDAANDGLTVGRTNEGRVPRQGRSRLLRHDGRQPLQSTTCRC
jgi:hypothetical protein